MERERTRQLRDDNYEERAYGARHRQLYREMRNETLAKVITDAFGGGPANILEVACGTGVCLEYLSRQGGTHSLTGVDLDWFRLRQVQERLAHLDTPAKLAFASGDCLPFANATFDVVFATRFIHLFPHAKKKRIFEELMRVVRDGGILVLEFYARASYWSRFGDRKTKSREYVFAHRPTKREVREIIGARVERLPLRLAGTGALYRVFGEQRLRRITNAARLWPLSLLLDEYFVVKTKS